MAASEKKLPASARKLQKARSEGQVARSRDLGHFAAVAAGVAVLVAIAPRLEAWLLNMLVDALRFNATAVQHTSFMSERLLELSLKFMWVVVPLGLLMVGVALASSVYAGGWVWTFKPMSPDFSRFNPIRGMGVLWSKPQLIGTVKATLLALLLGVIGAFYLHSQIEVFGGMLAMPIPTAVTQASQAIVEGLMWMLLALASFAAVDVPLQNHLHRSRLKMSHEELKQEHKDVEGSPEVKAKVRARMRELANRRMLAAVPLADLVVMNPTHYAVALKYDDAKMAAPRVVAKGTDLMAMRIRDAAQGAEVPVLQAPVLARALYAHAQVDQEIPAALFAAVAQVLAYVYQLRAALSGRVAMPGDLPSLNVPPELDPHYRRAEQSEGDE